MMDFKINDNARFKNIFNNIDESIILLNTKSNQIDFVNKKFLKNFQDQIFEVYN